MAYIDQQAAVNAVKEVIGDLDHECKPMMDFYHALWSVPAADVAPVVHGQWIYRGEEKGYQCSVCQSFCLLNYESDWCASECCPHCGAKMDDDSKEVKK